VQPFGNNLVTMSLTGAQIERLLEQQFCGTNQSSFKVLQISDTLRYTYDADRRGAADCTTADAVDATSIMLDGVPVVPAQSYRITVNNFLAGGGDGFGVLTQGTDVLGGALDLDALEQHLQALGTVSSPALGRITRVN
jgi:5'-nucleotidase